MIAPCLDYKYSVLLPLYVRDEAKWLVVALDSIINQSLFPDEIVVVGDGPLSTDLIDILKKYTEKYPNLFRVHIFPENRGLGMTLADGIKLCKNEYIARMDADDYSVPLRCEKQLMVFRENPELSVVGSNVDEFIDDISNVVSHVRLPEKHKDIFDYAKRRCPIRHPALMYRKSMVLASGNYRDYRHAQDYNLIVHMLLNGCRMYNIQDVLVYMRVSSDFYSRRGGVAQMKIVLKLKKEFLDCGFYSMKDFLISGVGNAAVCLLPNKVRKVFYKIVLRK